jgi:hypothetical protein
VVVAVVGAVVGGVAVSGRLVTSGCTDHFMSSGGSGDGTVVASGSGGAPSADGTVDVMLSARSHKELSWTDNGMPNH